MNQKSEFLLAVEKIIAKRFASDEMTHYRIMREELGKKILEFNRSISRSTRRTYAQRYRHWIERIRHGDWPHDHQMSQGTWGNTKAALTNLSAVSVLKKIDKYLDDPSDENQRQMEKSIALAQKINENYAPGGAGKKPRLIKRRSSARVKMRDYPDDWRDQIFETAGRPGAKDRRHEIAVLALTGCRVDELIKGVRVELIDENTARFEIQGAKVRRGKETADTGQKWRRFKVADLGDSVEGKYLAEWLNKNGGQAVVTTDSDKALRAALRRATTSTFGEMRSPVSPYFYKHAAASRLRSQGYAEQQIAKILGHASDGSQRAYGRRNSTGQGTGGRIIDIESELQPRESNRERIFERGQHVEREAGMEMEW
ncbi:MAG TPA: site-specific integrase [Guyparkeria sp.]|nr:site-specific integrase [Guyparkeria sp.]